MANQTQNRGGQDDKRSSRHQHITTDEQLNDDRVGHEAIRVDDGEAEDPRVQDLQRGSPGSGDQNQQQGMTNAGQNQNPGKGAPIRNVKPENTEREGAEDKGEEAALIKEEIRSRDA